MPKIEICLYLDSDNGTMELGIDQGGAEQAESGGASPTEERQPVTSISEALDRIQQIAEATMGTEGDDEEAAEGFDRELSFPGRRGGMMGRQNG